MSEYGSRFDVEGVLLYMCDFRVLSLRQWDVARRLNRRSRHASVRAVFISARIWRAFYNRRPQEMLAAFPIEIAALAATFRAQDQAAEAMRSIDDALEEHRED